MVKANGSKLWQQRYRFADREKTLSHGSYPDVGIAEARRKCVEAKDLLDQGIDPSTQKKLDRIHQEQSNRTTFYSVAEDYLEMAYERELADATIHKKVWHIETLAAPLYQRPVADITPAEVLELLKRIERSGRRETAKKLRGTLSGVFRLAVVTMRATHDPTAAVKGALLPVKVTNRAAITDEKILGQFLRDLDDYTGAGVIKNALLFQILTMTRPGEARGAKQHEMDLDKRSWTISADRMKMRRDHVVPLSDQAIDLIQRNWIDVKGVELVFPSLNSNRKKLSENAYTHRTSVALRRPDLADAATHRHARHPSALSGPRVPPHGDQSARRSAAFAVLDRGISGHELQERSRWSRPDCQQAGSIPGASSRAQSGVQTRSATTPPADHGRTHQAWGA